MMPITAAERATVIAALRLWQRALDENQDSPPDDLWMTASAKCKFVPLGVEKVEDLIARIHVFNLLTENHRSTKI